MIQRSRVDVEDCWDLTALFNSVEEWEVSCLKVESAIVELDCYQGTLGKSEQNLFEYFQKRFSIFEKLESISYYAYLKRAED